MNKLDQVREFMTESGQTIKETPTVGHNGQVRFKLMQEENREYLEAIEAGDIVEVLDALVDMQYILNGTILSHGLQDVFDEAYNRVHENNMTKRPFKKNALGKVIKPKGFKPVDLSDLV